MSDPSFGNFFWTKFSKKTWGFVLNHHKRHLPLLTKIVDLPWRQIKNLDFLESFHYENLSAGKILCCLYSDLLLQLHNFQLDFWLRNTGSKKRCSMSLSIETNGQTVEPLNFPVFRIPTQKNDLPTLFDGEKLSIETLVKALRFSLLSREFQILGWINTGSICWKLRKTLNHRWKLI